MEFAGKVRIAVIGAGVIGMSSAYRLQTELSNVEVTVISDKFTPELTSDGAAGIWEPYDLKGTDPNRSIGWSLDTYHHLHKLAQSPDSINCGVSYMRLVRLLTEPLDKIELPAYCYQMLHFRPLKYNDGYEFMSFVCEPRLYLPWISRRFSDAGGKFVTEKVTNLSRVCNDYDLVVNCPGLRADELLNDKDMVPIRGQVIKVRPKQSVNQAILSTTDTDRMYVIPGRDVITLGGTYDIGDPENDIREDVKATIMKNCKLCEPGIKDAEIMYDWCGSRPSRKSGTRLEIDSYIHPQVKVIHNYGHGGIGISIHWGCAGEVVNLARIALSAPVHSKL